MTKILIADDSVSIRQLGAFTLKSGGYDCTEAEDGAKALAACQSTDFDIVITDLNMPNMDGIELVKNLRADSNYAGTPILVLTTETDADKKAEGREAGVTGWIVKPFNPDSLLKAVARFAGD